MLDFTSAAYLGIRHPTARLKPWNQIALSKPAALAEPTEATIAAKQLAALQNCEASSLATSTLHLMWDIGGWLDPQATQLFVDSNAYAISRWGADRAASRGVRVRSFQHFDPESLQAAISRSMVRIRIPVVLADGFCPACGRPAPVAKFLQILRPFNGLLILDDTQTIGILGKRDPRTRSPYGFGGGGSLRWHNTNAADRNRVVLIASLAKGFNAPLASISGCAEQIRSFEESSRTRVHCSPPSIASIYTLQHALHVNMHAGELRRVYLARMIRRFRRQLASARLRPLGNLFPMQSIAPPTGWTSLDFVRALNDRGVIAVATRSAETPHSRVSFLLNADHKPRDVDRLARTILELASQRNARAIADSVYV